MKNHITTVTAQNLKGRSFRHSLTPCTIIAGKNMAGKTSITDAIRLALLGRLPEVGGKPGDAFALSSGAKMTATVKLSDGEEITRTIEESRGSIKCTPAKIDPTYASALLDVDAWFAMTERERIDYVFTHVTLPEDKTPAGIIASLHRITFGEAHSEIVEEAKAAVISDVQDVLNRETGPAPLDLSRLPDAIVAAYSTLEEDFTLWNRRAKDSDGAIRMFAELKMRENECTADTLTDLRGKVTAADNDAKAANETLGALKERMANSHTAKRRRAEILSALNEAKPTPAPLPTFVASMNIDEVRSSLRHANETLAKAPLPDPQKLKEAREDFEKKQATVIGISSETENLRRNIEEKEAELDAISAMGLCKDCTAKMGTSIQESLVAKRGALSQRIPALETAEQQKDAAFGVLRRLETATEGAQEVIANKADLEQKIRQYENEEVEAKRAIERVKASNASALANWENRMQSLREEQSRLKVTEAPDEQEIQRAQAAFDTAHSAVLAARAKVKDAETLAHDIKRESQAAEEAEKAAARRDVIKAVKEKLNDIKAELVGAAFGEVLKVANTITVGVLRAPLEYDTTKNEVGMRLRSGFVSTKVFSGTEKLLAYVAVSVGLAAKSPLRVAIIDELARLTPHVRGIVFDNLAAAIFETGVIDQAICILPTDAPIESSDGVWSVVNVESEVAK